MRVPSSNLSSASASSSTMGSPLSNPAQLAPMDWAAPHGLGASPGIVDHADAYITGGGDYSYQTGVDSSFNPAFEFGTKAPGFVGELSQVPRSRVLPPTSSSVSSISHPLRPHHQHHGSISSAVSSTSHDSSAASTVTVVPASGLALDINMAQAASSSVVAGSPSVTTSTTSTVSSGRVFASPSISSSSTFSSPPPPAWTSPVIEAMSPLARPKPARLLSSPFFTQSSGQYVPPLGASCWFPLVDSASLTRSAHETNSTSSRPADPSILHPHDVRPMGLAPYENPYPTNNAYPASPALSASPQLRNGSTSPFINSNYQQYSPFPVPVDPQGRRPSLVSYGSGFSGEQPFSGDESKEKQRCPHPDCGKTFKDLKAHMLTHQTERPEKCPITSCDYHTKGFARK
jgi:hypothetical protein